jgi:predicted DNA-binding protein (MmcQ/YjbR family)
VCLALPEAVEVTAWGHPNFRAGKKTFAVLEVYEGVLSICFKPDLETYRRIVKDERFFVTPYLTGRGWLSLTVDGPLDWSEVEGLCVQSYRHVALKRMLTALDAQDETSGTRRKRAARKP